LEDLSKKFDGKLEDLSSKFDKKLEDLSDKFDDKLTVLSCKFDEKLDSGLKGLENKFDGKLAAVEGDLKDNHQQIMDKLNFMQIDQDIIWDKVGQSEKEIARIKAQLQKQ
ncbi:hypothetical protein HRF87_14760, partial [Bacillus sp. CRN 9]|nr:hypothetical protein [Bacillus sp. CRN 9]